MGAISFFVKWIIDLLFKAFFGIALRMRKAAGGIGGTKLENKTLLCR